MIGLFILFAQLKKQGQPPQRQIELSSIEKKTITETVFESAICYFMVSWLLLLVI